LTYLVLRDFWKILTVIPARLARFQRGKPRGRHAFGGDPIIENLLLLM